MSPEPYYADDTVTLHAGDALDVLRTLPDGSADCIVTSPPYYGLRDYGEPGQYGLEASPAEYVDTMRTVFGEVRRVLADDGTLWLNLGDSYANDAKWGGSSGGKHVESLHGQTGIGRGKRTTGLPPKSLVGIPWQVAFSLQDDGWILRNAIVWHKPNAMPDSVTDRLGCRHETVFLFAKSHRYHFDLDAIREPLAFPEALDGTRVFGGKAKGGGIGKVGAAARKGGLHTSVYGGKGTGHAVPQAALAQDPSHQDANERGRNPGDVWTLPTQPFPDAHFAVMPPALAERCIKAGCRPGGVVLDPFAGSCTTGMVAAKLGHRFVGIDLSPTYLDLALRTRLAQSALLEGGEADLTTAQP